MRPLLIDISFPALQTDMTQVQAHIEKTGRLPSLRDVPPPVALDARMCYVRHLLRRERNDEALNLIDQLRASDAVVDLPLLYGAWLDLARMTLLIAREEQVAALTVAENALRQLAEITRKKQEDFLAILASLVYNLAAVHNLTGEDSRASKELIKAQKLFERLVKKNEQRFSAMLLQSVEASTLIIKSRTKQMNVLAHYQSNTELYTHMLEEGGGENTRMAMTNLVDSLKKEGDIMLQMGNARGAVRYYTKALRYQKKLSKKMGHRELTLSIGLAKALMRLVNRRAAAEQLLTSLLPLAKRLDAEKEIIEIENLLNNKNRNNNIMTILKSIFTIALLMVCSLGAQAQLIVGHRGSVWGVENTEAAFVNGAQKGAWGLECDIHLTSDGTFVICHDATTKRIGGDERRLGDLTVSEAKNIHLSQTRQGTYYVGQLMTLGEYLDLCNNYNVVPVIEIKFSDCKTIHSDEKNPADDNFDGVPALINMLESKNCLDKAVIISFMPGVIEYLHRNYPSLNVQVLAGSGDGDGMHWANWCIDRGIDLDATYSIVTQEVVDTLHRAGLKINVWTVDNPDVFKQMQDYGVDFITTNVNFPQQ